MKKVKYLNPGIVLVAALCLPVVAATGKQVYDALGIKVKDVLAGSVLNARILPGEGKQIASVVTYFTGKKDRAEALNVKLAVFNEAGEELQPVYLRDFGMEQGGYVGSGDLQLLDLDRDGVSEIIVCFDDFREPLVEQRVCEIILQGESGFRTAWTGQVKYDSTKAVRDIPQERRDRFVREFDWPSTLRTRGLTLYVNKKVISVAGERLDEPRIVQETFPLQKEPQTR